MLSEYPEDARAAQNLDHVRYELKKLLQNQPEKQEQEDDQQQDQEGLQSVFEYAETDIEGAAANAESDTVELVVPGKRQP